MLLAVCANVTIADEAPPVPSRQKAPFGAARQIGRIEAHQLVECSGLEVSPAQDDLLWAVNDGGNGPFLYALGMDGRGFHRRLPMTCCIRMGGFALNRLRSTSLPTVWKWLC